MSVPYVFGLSVVSELIAFLCIGLVRRWGEVAPAWMPFIGGRPVRPLAAVVPAVLGGLALTALFGSVPVGDGQTLTVFGVNEDTSYVNGSWKALAMICTAPIRIWGPVVLVLAGAYYLRRRPIGTGPTPAAVKQPRTDDLRDETAGHAEWPGGLVSARRTVLELGPPRRAGHARIAPRPSTKCHVRRRIPAQPGRILARLIDVSLSSVVESAFQSCVIGADEAGIEPAPQHSKSKVRRG